VEPVDVSTPNLICKSGTAGDAVVVIFAIQNVQIFKWPYLGRFKS
jgi:hypothetical protein